MVNDKEFRRIQHQLNSLYANRDDRRVEKELNLINSQLHEMINGKKKKQPKLADVIFDLKVIRENLSPMNETILHLYDTYIDELELIYNATQVK
jgi:hypothetical protein